MFHYKASLVITGEIKGASCDKFHQELRFESLADTRWSHRFFYRRSYTGGLTDKNAVSEEAYLTCSTTQNKIKTSPARIEVSQNSLLRDCFKSI